jgi:hypothetical protein
MQFGAPNLTFEISLDPLWNQRDKKNINHHLSSYKFPWHQLLFSRIFINSKMKYLCIAHLFLSNIGSLSYYLLYIKLFRKGNITSSNFDFNYSVTISKIIMAASQMNRESSWSSALLNRFIHEMVTFTLKHTNKCKAWVFPSLNNLVREVRQEYKNLSKDTVLNNNTNMIAQQGLIQRWCSLVQLLVFCLKESYFWPQACRCFVASLVESISFGVFITMLRQSQHWFPRPS